MRSHNQTEIKKYMKLMGNAVSVLSILFVISALLRTDFSMITVRNWYLFFAACMAGVLIKTATVFLSGRAWCVWLEFFSGRRCDRREAVCVYAKANIGKYLPGNVMHYVERNLFAGKLELSQKQIAAASMVEVCSLVLAAFLMGVLLAFSQMRAAAQLVLAKFALSDKQLVLLAAGICVFLAASVFLCFCFRRKLAAFLKEITAKGGKFGKTFLHCFLIYMTVLMLLGIILVLLYGYMAGWPSFGQAVSMTAAYIIAWVLGFVVPGAPGGIGVRELALTLLLTPLTGAQLVAALSVLHRLITVLGDFTAYAFRNYFTKKGAWPRHDSHIRNRG